MSSSILYSKRKKFAEDVMSTFLEAYSTEIQEKHPLDYWRQASYGAEIEDTTKVEKRKEYKWDPSEDINCKDKKKKKGNSLITPVIDGEEVAKGNFSEGFKKVSKNTLSKYSCKNKDKNKKIIKLVEMIRNMELMENDEVKQKGRKIKKKDSEVVLMPVYKEEKKDKEEKSFDERPPEKEGYKIQYGGAGFHYVKK